MEKKNTWGSVLRILSKQKAVLFILAIMVIMIFPKTTFYTAYNWLDMIRSASILEIVAFGVTMSVLCGGCDLSCGGTLCMGGIVAVMVINGGGSLLIALLAAILSGAAVGMINGFLVVQQKTEPFIITLGMGMLLKGVCQQLTDAHPLTCSSLSFMNVSNKKYFGVPSLVIYMSILLIVFFLILRFTSYGRNLYAIGGNYDVAKYSGIRVVPIKWSTFVISGAVSALAGLLLASRMNTGSSVYGDTTGMMVNCGCVIGGTSFAGGQGGIVQSFIGIFVMQLINNCMNQLGINAYTQKLLLGALIVAIIASDCYGRKLAKEREFR